MSAQCSFERSSGKGSTSLFIRYCGEGWVDLVRQRLGYDREQIDINGRCDDSKSLYYRRTALTAAAKKSLGACGLPNRNNPRCEEIIRRLLMAGANPKAKDAYGQTARDIVVSDALRAALVQAEAGDVLSHEEFVRTHQGNFNWDSPFGFF